MLLGDGIQQERYRQPGEPQQYQAGIVVPLDGSSGCRDGDQDQESEREPYPGDGRRGQRFEADPDQYERLTPHERHPAEQGPLDRSESAAAGSLGRRQHALAAGATGGAGHEATEGSRAGRYPIADRSGGAVPGQSLRMVPPLLLPTSQASRRLVSQAPNRTTAVPAHWTGRTISERNTTPRTIATMGTK